MTPRGTVVRLWTALPFGVAVDGFDPGRVVRLKTGGGRQGLARVVHGALPTSGSENVVGVDADLQHQLRIAPGESLELQPVDLPPASQVQAVPAFSTSVDRVLQQAVRDTLTGAGAAVWAGCRFRAPLGSGNGTGTFEVVEVLAGQRAAPEGALVTPDTTVHVHAPSPAQLARLGDDLSLDDVAGLDGIVEQLRDLVETPLVRPELYRQLGISPPRGVLLHGPPGVGKTYLARALANDLNVHLEYVSAPELVGTSYGKTEANLRALFDAAARATPALILIDEIDALVAVRRHLSAQTDYRMVAQMLAALDGLKRLDGVVVLGTTNRPEAIDPAFRRPGRLDAELFVAPPDADARLAILRLYFGRMPVTAELGDHLAALVEHTHGFVPADLAALARQAGLLALRRAGAAAAGGDGVVVDVADVVEARKQVEPSLLRGTAIRRPHLRLDEVIGHDDAVKRLRALAGDLAGRRAARLLLVGPSGAGKSLLITALAGELGAHLLDVTPADLFTAWLGETEEALRDTFRLAAHVVPVVLAFDNLDGVAPKRDLESGPAARRVVDQLLAQMDRLPDGVVLAAATSHEDLLDPAVRRRFDEVIVLEPRDDTTPEGR